MFTNKQNVLLANKKDHCRTTYIYTKLNGLPKSTKKYQQPNGLLVNNKYLSTGMNKLG